MEIDLAASVMKGFVRQRMRELVIVLWNRISLGTAPSEARRMFLVSLAVHQGCSLRSLTWRLFPKPVVGTSAPAAPNLLLLLAGLPIALVLQLLQLAPLNVLGVSR